ncbi:MULTISPECIES: alkaline phosphatase D family protein [Flavobacteriaceae]|uniref:alkaline phosphatase D family protein n=1 Tax=Flavobacteriaceae TaxID=49546 RepID=UPI0014919057|nr:MULTISPECIES: alkaline phosphatase D family protein [Allomuricauda]MDC6367594.1 alkaline phosphatase D family protein [Muricauda sp. AC10]
MKQIFLLLGGIILLSSCKSSKQTTAVTSSSRSKDSNFVVAFGSCNKQYETNPYWDDILTENPRVWIWGGDNIYADTDDMIKLKGMYAEQNGIAGYALLKSKVPVVGTWDDHDYGLNDGGEEFSMKKESQKEFLDFMEVPKNDKRRAREGIYASHTYKTDQGKVKILVLDTRYFRSSLLKDPNPDRRYQPNTEANSTMLGNAQWEWLKQELNSSDADFNLIISSIQFLSREHGFETWGNFPNEVSKLEDIIAASKAKGVIILSGDRHISEISRTEIPNLSYPLIDFTSSGLTHSYSNFTSEPNPFRVGKVVSSTSYGIVDLDFKKKQAHFKIMGENGKVLEELKQTY